MLQCKSLFALTPHVLDLLDVVGEAADGQHQQQLHQPGHQRQQGARQQRRQRAGVQRAPDDRHAALRVDLLVHRRDGQGDALGEGRLAATRGRRGQAAGVGHCMCVCGEKNKKDRLCSMTIAVTGF